MENQEIKTHKIVLFYRYVSLHVESMHPYFQELCKRLELMGRVLVAPEGVNGTLAGREAAVDEFIEECKKVEELNNVDWKINVAVGDKLPFNDLHIKLVPELIGCGEQRTFIDSHISFDSTSFGGLKGTGVHLTASDFHEALGSSSENRILLDIRNEFEYDIGHFQGAVSLGTNTYAETWKALDNIFAEPGSTNKEVFMYCTGGIRCEKASAYLRAKGLSNVYQLQGGIHKYLEQFPRSESHFIGKEFVFDARVALPQKLQQRTDDSQLDERHEERSACEDATDGDEIVGRCIDCNDAHDVYSGSIICTVCHMPVLYCPRCVRENLNPGEYYCRNHRGLKGIYFFHLDRYSDSQLNVQLQQLQDLHSQLQGVEHRNRRRTMIRQQQRIQSVLRSRQQQSSGEKCEVSDEGGTVNGVRAEGWGFWQS